VRHARIGGFFLVADDLKDDLRQTGAGESAKSN
jgi:hypothetical protein